MNLNFHFQALFRLNSAYLPWTDNSQCWGQAAPQRPETFMAGDFHKGILFRRKIKTSMRDIRDSMNPKEITISPFHTNTPTEVMNAQKSTELEFD